MNTRLLTILAIVSAGWISSSPGQGQEVARPKQISLEGIAKFPFSMTGQIIFSSGNSDYQGTGTVVYQRSALTAAHNLWDTENGWSSNIEFNRARNGRSTPQQAFARRIYVLAGYQANARRYGSNSVRAFAFDLGGLRFAYPVAGGSYAGWRADARLLTGQVPSIALGYGAELHSGDHLLYVQANRGYERIFGGFFENTALTFEGGMSGGPVFSELGSGDMRLTGVIVAGSDDPPTGGIRALDQAAARFLINYLRY